MVGPSLDALQDPVLKQGCHPLLHRHTEHLLYGGPNLDESFDLVCNNQEFVKARPAPVAGVFTRLTSPPAKKRKPVIIRNPKFVEGLFPVSTSQSIVFFLRRVVSFLAILSDSSGQPLR